MNEASPHPFSEQLTRLRRLGLAAGAGGLVMTAFGLPGGAASFFQGYLFAYFFWIGLSLGCLSVLMLHHLVAGGWGFVTQRFLEAGALTVGLMAVLFLPLFFGMHTLYPWTHDDVVAGSEVLQHKRPYLSVPFFVIRALIYFACWIALAYLLNTWSLRQDETGHAAYTVRMRRLSAGGLIAQVLLVTLASVDWIMSLEPQWYSTIYGWLIIVGEALTALAFAVVVLSLFAKRAPLAAVVRTRHFHDYGNLILAFVILWTYMMFAQYLIMWSGNIPEDIAWYVRRKAGARSWIVPLMILFHFAVPLLLLLSRRTKRSVRALSTLAVALLAVHAVFVAWLVFPAFHEAEPVSYVVGATAFVGIGGCWVAAFAWLLIRRPVLPAHDPRFEEVVEAARRG